MSQIKRMRRLVRSELDRRFPDDMPFFWRGLCTLPTRIRLLLALKLLVKSTPLSTIFRDIPEEKA